MGLEAVEGNAVSRRIVVCLGLWCACVAALSSTASNAAAAGEGKTSLIVVVGAAGDEQYGKIFAEEADQWHGTALLSGVELSIIGNGTDKSGDKAALQAKLKQEAAAGDAPLWLVLIGHGTFDGRTAAFNLRGPDVSSAELAEWLKEVARPTIIVDTTAASAPFLTALSAPNRVVVTATKSGTERNYARFGRYFAKRVIDPAADLDKDERTSLFEAYLAAARDTAEFYKGEGRIQTEHPLLDDDGDGKGVRADFFVRGKLVKKPAGESGIDGDFSRRLALKPSANDALLTPAQLTQRDELEAELAELRARKAETPEPEYFAELERLLLKLARLQVEPAK
jgi:hypothetical protein